MWKYFIYGLAFFGATLIIQYIANRVRKDHNKGRISFFTGFEVVIGIAILGLIQGELFYFAEIIGFVIADELGKKVGWH